MIGKLWLESNRIINNIIYNNFPSAKILLYHCVTDTDTDSLCISKTNFVDQITFLKKEYKIISIYDFQQHLQENNLEKKTILLTFDDGYLDNYENVYPIIKKLGVPVTIFVSNYILQKKIRTLASFSKKMLEMKKSNLVTFGAHTKSHRKLSDLKLCEQRLEIISNKLFLQKLIKEKIKFFAFPYGQRGDYSDATLDIIKQSGFKLALTAYPGIVTVFSDRYKLPRYAVKNWSLNVFKQKTGL